MDEGITIKGLTELQAKLEALSQKQADACIRKALMAGAVIEQAAIVERAPVKVGTGGYLPAGALKSDIEVKMRRDSSTGRIEAVIAPGRVTAFAARLVEFGHRIVQGAKLRKGGKHTGDVPPHPFLRPAYEATRDEVSRVIATTLATEIEAAAGRKGTS